MYILNSISLNMLEEPDKFFIFQKPVSKDKIPATVVSAIGHADTARVISHDLGFEIPPNRISVKLSPTGGHHYLAQYGGPRLPEGATELPEGARIKYYIIQVASLDWLQSALDNYY